MIRLIQRRLIIPRGDTGSFSIPVLKNSTDNIAVFTIFDEVTRTKMFQKLVKSEGDVINIAFTHNDTVNLKPGKYVWDIKYYSNPEFVDEELVNGEEIDSYYAGFSLPVCEIRETADNYLVSPDAPSATLSPSQLDIITSAINGLNEAIRKTNENVEHYPEIRDEVWYVWDAEQGDYVSTDVRANGIVGNGIESAVLNNDYTLTLNFTDGTSFTSSSIRGETGNGIDDIVLNNDFTLTISYTDGESYTTPSIRGPVGATPQLSIGTVQDGAVAAATITGTAENPVLNLTLPNAHVPTRVSQLENDSGYLTTEIDPTVPAWAKAAQKPSYTAEEVGAPTVAEMNTAIGEAISQINSFDMAIVQTLPAQNISTHTIYLVPKTGETNDVYDEYVYINNGWEMIGNTQIDLSDYATKDELPDVPVQDVQVNGASVLNNGVANVPAANTTGVIGVVKPQGQNFSIDNSSVLNLRVASTAEIKAGTTPWRPATPNNQHWSTFYGLAKAAGDATQSSSSNVVGNYTDEAKTAIQTMLDVPAKSDIPDVPVQDVKVNGTSILDNGVANVPICNENKLGLVKTYAAGQVNTGIFIDTNGYINTQGPTVTNIKTASSNKRPIMPNNQHLSVFYGLAKAAGADMANLTGDTIGIYPDAQKEAIQSMLGITQMLAPENPNLVATQAYAIGDVFAANGKLYKATAAIAQDEAIIPDTNCVETTMAEAGGKIKDVQVNSVSIVGNDGVADVPIASTSTLGVVKPRNGFGISVDAAGQIYNVKPNDVEIKAGIQQYNSIVPYNQHLAAFYGLSKVAGVDLANETVTLGTYPETSKTAIKEMLGVQDGLKVVRLI